MTRFQVSLTGFTELREIEDSWTNEDFARLLDRMEFGDTSELAPAELREMCVLSLQDRDPDEAAALLLEHRLGDVLRKGQIEFISHEMTDDDVWKESADMPLQERLFHVGSLLHQAFPRAVPVPDAVEVRLAVTAQDAEGERLLSAPLHESLVVRLLAGGMPPTATLNRMFGDAVRGARFPEAESIAWIIEAERVDARNVSLRVIGSGNWLDALRDTESYTSNATTDAPTGR